MADVMLTYKGTTIAELNDSGSKMLRTAGKYCEADIGVEYVKPSGGETTETPKDVNFIDYNGRILYAYTAEEANALTDLPANPSNPGLTAQGWNWTLAQIKTQLAAAQGGVVWVGQSYTTTSGKTEVDIVLKDGAVSPYLAIGVNGTVTVDWGDGSATDTISGTSVGSLKYQNHTYATGGAYTITIAGSQFSFGNANGTVPILQISAAKTTSKKYADCIHAIRLGSNCNINVEFAFAGCRYLETITIPSGANIAGGTFNGCAALKCAVLPAGVTAIYNTFRSCSALEKVSIPFGVTIITNYAFGGCTLLKSVTIPSSVTGLNNFAFSSNGLTAVVIPNGTVTIGGSSFQSSDDIVEMVVGVSVTTINSSAFAFPYSLEDLHLLPTTPPAMNNVNVLNGYKPFLTIYVPYSADHSILDAYKNATNWSTYASIMKEEPQ